MRRALGLSLLALAGTASSVTVFSNGSNNGLSSVAPQMWDPNGIIQDFSVDAALFDRIRIEALDTTTPIGQVSSLTTARIRIYNITGRTLADLSFNETPVFDRTYTRAANTFRSTLSGLTQQGADIEYFDFIGDGALGVGRFALYYNLPGQTSFPQHFWLSSTPPGGATEGARVFGPGTNGAIGGPDSEGAFQIYRDAVPEPASVIALLSGVALLLKRRRRAFHA